MPWLVTFADMLALLLVFFVTLISMASLGMPRYGTALGSLRQAFGLSSLGEGPTASQQTPYIGPGADLLPGGRGLLPQLASHAEESAPTHPGAHDSGVALRLPATAFFADTASTLSPAGEQLLDRLAGLIVEEPLAIAVTVEVPPEPAAPETPAWQRGAARAGSLAQHLAHAGIGVERLSATARMRLAEHEPPGPATNGGTVELLLDPWLVAEGKP